MNKTGLSIEKPTSEQLIAVNEKGELTAVLVNRTRAHLEGILHASEHIWVYGSDGQILLQKRAPEKTFGDMLDISAA
ncbi:MAG: hypothetical protein ACOYN2_03585 [Patescibacteria group bacterium]